MNFKTFRLNSNKYMLYEVDTISWWKKHFISFIDECTLVFYIYLLNSKDEAIYAFKQYKNGVEYKLNLKIKIIRSDRGGEYESPLQRYVWNMELFIKLLQPIHHSQMICRNERTEH